MFWLMLATAAIGVAGKLVSAAQEKKNAQAELQFKMDEANRQESQAQGQLGNQLEQAKTQSDQQVQLGMEQSYLTQKANEAGLLDMTQQGLEATGSLRARTASSGIQQGTTLQTVADASIRTSLADKKAANDAYRGGAILGVQDAANQFKAGSAYMNLYQEKKTGLTADLTAQTSYLKSKYDSYDSFGYWLGAGLDAAGTALNFASSGSKNFWWGSSGSKYGTNPYSSQYARTTDQRNR